MWTAQLCTLYMQRLDLLRTLSLCSSSVSIRYIAALYQFGTERRCTHAVFFTKTAKSRKGSNDIRVVIGLPSVTCHWVIGFRATWVIVSQSHTEPFLLLPACYFYFTSCCVRRLSFTFRFSYYLLAADCDRNRRSCPVALLRYVLDDNRIISVYGSGLWCQTGFKVVPRYLMRLGLTGQNLSPAPMNWVVAARRINIVRCLRLFAYMALDGCDYSHERLWRP
jgi:hypothetical protein